MATDIFLPAFTEIAVDLEASAAAVQLTLTTFMFGLALGQLILGPASDRWGRRPVLIVALGLFTVTSIAMAFSPTIEVLIALRIFQGITGSAGVVIARAVAVDLSTGATAVRALSFVALGGAVTPLVVPSIGAFVAEWFGWRGALGALGLFALAMFLAAVLFVPESLPPEKRHGVGLLASFARFGTLLRIPQFTAYILTFGFGFVAMLSYIAASPFVGQVVLGMSPIGFAFAYTTGSSALIITNLLNARFAVRFGPARMLRLGVLIGLTAGVALTALTLTDTLSIHTFVMGAFFLISANGLVASNSNALALSFADVGSRGAGSALLGASQFLLGGAVSPLVGLWGEGTAVPMALTVLGSFVVVALCALAARPRDARGTPSV